MPSFKDATLNKDQQRFLILAFIWFLAWQIIDFIAPIDQWLTDSIVALSRAGIVLLFNKSTICYRIQDPFQGYMITDSVASFKIAHSCNGKAILFLFTAFLWAIPNKQLSKKIMYTLSGFTLIFFANIIRIITLFQVLRNTPDWFEFLHHSLFQWLMYVIILFLWMMFLDQVKLFGRGSS